MPCYQDFYLFQFIHEDSQTPSLLRKNNCLSCWMWLYRKLRINSSVSAKCALWGTILHLLFLFLYCTFEHSSILIMQLCYNDYFCEIAMNRWPMRICHFCKELYLAVHFTLTGYDGEQPDKQTCRERCQHHGKRVVLPPPSCWWTACKAFFYTGPCNNTRKRRV